MRVAFVTTYPPSPCAIGLYTQQLARALLAARPDWRIAIAAESQGFSGYADGSIPVRPCYRRDSDYGADILAAVAELGPSLVHFQHAPDLFGEDERLPTLLGRLRARGLRTVVTLHTVNGPGYERLLWLRPPLRRFYQALARTADRIIVHQQRSMADRLRAQGIPAEALAVIAHGTPALPLPDAAEARRALDLPPDARVLLFFGFVHVQKNVHTVLEAFLRVAPSHPRAYLLIAGKPWGDRFYNDLYIRGLKIRAGLSAAHARVRFRDGYVPPTLVPTLYAAADVVLLPHWQRYGSASGVLHQVVAAGKPFLCAAGPKFENAMGAFASTPEIFLPPTHVGAWARAMAQLLDEAPLRDRVRAAAARFAAETAWPVSAAAHLAVYDPLLAG